MSQHCEKHGVTHLAMPKIGCGLDGLKWDKVSAIIEEVFKHTNVHVYIYH